METPHKNKKLNIDNINKKLESMGLSQIKIASELGVSREIVSKWLKNEKFPRPEKLLRLSQMLKLPFDEIVVRLPTDNEPRVAFRKKGRHKISKEYIDSARYTGSLLENLVPYLPFDQFSRPCSLIDPQLDYEYIHNVAKDIRKQIGNIGTPKITFQDLISFFSRYRSVIIPVFWGAKDQHENALHIYLPKSMTTWIFLNLDSRVHDFKFWIAHELGHAKSPDLKDDQAEDFADDFAGALLVDSDTAERLYNDLVILSTIPKQIAHLKEISEELVVSPLTVYYEINKYARHVNKSIINLETDNTIYKATTVFNRQFHAVSNYLFDNKKPSAAEYISCVRNTFQSPFFDALISFIKENKKSAGFIQNLLNLPLTDAQYLYEELR